MPKSHEIGRIAARIPSDLKRQVKMLAAKEETTIDALLKEALTALLASRKQKAA